MYSYVQENKKLRVLMINKKLRKYLARKNGNGILIWSWNNPSGMALAHFRMLINELLKKDLDIFPVEAPLNILYRRYSVCMANNGKDTKHTWQISRRFHFVRNSEKCKIHKIY